MEVVIFANAPEALTELCGVSLLERQLRILQRLGFDRVAIVSETPEQIRAAVEPPSWARKNLATRIMARVEFQSHDRALFLPGDIYCDARLLRALTECEGACALIDSAPPDEVLALLGEVKKGPTGFVSGVVVAANYESLGEVDTIDAAQVPAYIRGMRRTIRPVFFPAPAPHLRRVAERIILDTGQNGTLDIPARVQSPIETWIMHWLCRTSITPNQISVFNLMVAFAATAFFATGHLALGMIPALSVGVIDGLDGKQARVKIETTESGKWEHYLDLLYETSWWAALAFWFQRSGQLPFAWLYFFLIMAGTGLEKLAKRVAHLPEVLLDDYGPFDRFVRLIAARRDVYIWSLAIGLAFGCAPTTFRFCAFWGMATAAVRWLRAGMIVAARRPS